MNKIENINLGGRAFFADQDAYLKLKDYVQRLERRFASVHGGSEIIQDVENRLAEIFIQMLGGGREIVSLKMVAEAVATMGEPEAFDGGSYEEQPQHDQSVYGSKRLYRDMEHAKLGGVCAGLSAYLNMDLALVRILSVVFLLMSFGTIATIYLILWIALPMAVTPAQRLEMKGEPITLANIEKTAAEGYVYVKKGFSRARERWNQSVGRSNSTLMLWLPLGMFSSVSGGVLF